MSTEHTVEALDAEIDAAFTAAYENPAFAKVAHWTLPNCAPLFDENGYVDFLTANEAGYCQLVSSAVEGLGLRALDDAQ